MRVRRNQIDPQLLYKGVVLDNDDSKHPDGVKAGRVRVKILGVLDELESDDHYPWALPDWQQSDGSTQWSGTFDVPKKNAIVNIRFQSSPDGSGSVYHPVYTSTHAYKDQVLKDAEWHYPNRKVHRFSNGNYIVVDTEDDSLHLYNPGETHVKSKGKLTIKCEESFVIISDVEVGIRAPEVAIRAKDHLILESEGKLTMRSKERMNIECRDDIFMLARQNMDLMTANEELRIQARGDNGEGKITVKSWKDNVEIIAEGQEARESSIKIEASGQRFVNKFEMAVINGLMTQHSGMAGSPPGPATMTLTADMLISIIAPDVFISAA